MSTATMPLSDWIRELRTAKGLSREELSELTRAAGNKVSAANIAKLEYGKVKKPTWNTVRVLAGVLGASLDEWSAAADDEEPPAAEEPPKKKARKRQQ
jgi:transcriptional regulator with XRE-family HTH domain